MNSKWNYQPPNPERQQQAKELAEKLGMSSIMAQLLIQRGIRTESAAKRFLRPMLSELIDPFLMNDMDVAVDRLNDAMGRKERIMVYGDYDVDGCTAVALVYRFLLQFYSNIEYYIPDRYEEGYGISQKGLDHAAEAGVKLIIILDCGIKAIDEIRKAKEMGIDFIICDHHVPDDELPCAVAILNPKRQDSTYPFKDLCGCGVGFKLAQGYVKKYDLDPELLSPLLDLQVVSIASDLVSMTGENRILAHFGLKRLNENPRKGLLAMINLAKLEPGHINIDDIVFKIGPRINAAGRMESGRMAVELLTATDDQTAFRIGEQINDSNNERKSIDREITQEALEMVRSGNALETENVTIVYNPTWNKGVVGIVASRLVEAYYKPTVVLTKSNGFVTGSARSVQGFDLYASIESCADLLENFGGHVYAAGLTMKEENLEEFCKRMNRFVSGNITREELTPVVEIDGYLDFSQITPKFTRILKQFQPFGPGNSNPVFLTEDVYDAGNGRKVGAGGVHLKLDLMQESQPYRQIAAIGFNMADNYDYIKAGNPIDICYSIVENFYRGSSTIQLRLKDIREREDLI